MGEVGLVEVPGGIGGVVGVVVCPGFTPVCEAVLSVAQLIRSEKSKEVNSGLQKIKLVYHFWSSIHNLYQEKRKPHLIFRGLFYGLIKI